MNKKLIYILFSLPLLFLLVLFLLAYIPSKLNSPEYNYLYSLHAWDSKYQFSITWSKLTKIEWYSRYQDDFDRDLPKLFLHDVYENKSTKVDFDDYKDKTIIEWESPDWYTFQRYSSNYWVFPFFNHVWPNYTLRGSISSHHQNLYNNNYSVNFLWWLDE